VLSFTTLELATTVGASKEPNAAVNPIPPSCAGFVNPTITLLTENESFPDHDFAFK